MARLDRAPLRLPLSVQLCRSTSSSSSLPSERRPRRRSPPTVHLGGRFFIPPRRHVTHKIGILPGDGIGPEVISRGPQGARRGRRGARRRRVRPRAVPATCGRAKSCPTPSSTSWPASTPSCSAPSAPPRSRRASSSGGCCCGCASSSTSTSTSGPSACSPARRRRWPARAPTTSTWSSSGRTPKVPTPVKAGSSARARRTRSPPRARSTPASASSGASATPSSWPAPGPAST